MRNDHERCESVRGKNPRGTRDSTESSTWLEPPDSDYGSEVWESNSQSSPSPLRACNGNPRVCGGFRVSVQSSPSPSIAVTYGVVSVSPVSARDGQVGFVLGGVVSQPELVVRAGVDHELDCESALVMVWLTAPRSAVWRSRCQRGSMERAVVVPVAIVVHLVWLVTRTHFRE